MAINDVKVPISSAWEPGQRVRRGAGTFEAVNVIELDRDELRLQSALISRGRMEPLIRTATIVYAAMLAAGIAYALRDFWSLS